MFVVPVALQSTSIVPLWAVVRVKVAAANAVFFKLVCSVIALETQAVVATCVDPLVALAIAVGAVGDPVRLGEAKGANPAVALSTYNFVAACRFETGAPFKERQQLSQQQDYLILHYLLQIPGLL